MEQALLNILKNALEAIGEHGVVTLRVARAGSGVVLAVHDSGPGIEPAAREHLFTPFYTTKENGQGIGLTLTAEILTAHGFEFALENAPEGARFVIKANP
jgi:signal transduction histidine kinase